MARQSEPVSRALDSVWPVISAGYPRGRYLSQQFVEDLCSSDGMTDALLQEIERVVFEAHDVSARDGAIDFRELVELKAGRHRQAREREEEALETVSDRIARSLRRTSRSRHSKSSSQRRCDLSLSIQRIAANWSPKAAKSGWRDWRS